MGAASAPAGGRGSVQWRACLSVVPNARGERVVFYVRVGKGEDGQGLWRYISMMWQRVCEIYSSRASGSNVRWRCAEVLPLESSYQVMERADPDLRRRCCMSVLTHARTKHQDQVPERLCQKNLPIIKIHISLSPTTLD